MTRSCVRVADQHEVKTTSRLVGDRWSFTAECRCGWQSQELSTAGLASGAGAHHRDHPDVDTGVQRRTS